MSLPKKGSRIVEADSERYRWLIRRKPTYFQGLQAPMTLAVEAVDGQRGGILHVGLRVSRPDNWIAPHQTAVTPKVVRQIIAAARAAGWQPEAGGVFEFEYGLIRDRS